MFKKILLSALLLLIAAYIVAAVTVFNRKPASQVCQDIRLVIKDSVYAGFITKNEVSAMLKKKGISPLDQPMDRVRTDSIEQVLSRHPLIDRVECYKTPGGSLNIEVSQRRPMMRLMVDGYDAYVTEDGFIFESPDASALYVPVVTGPYRPITPPSYEGRMGDFIAERVRESQERIREIGRDKIALYREEDTIRVRRTAERKRSVKKQWREDKEDFRKRVDELRRQKRAKLKYYDGMLRDIQSRIDAVTARQRAEALKQKKLEERYDDFLKLINFVKWLESDSFWSSEVVQIVARTSSSGRLEADLVPRSGNFRIVLGNLDDADRKMDKLMRFYRDGLSRIGWDRYRIINVKYENQVVCTE